MLPFAGTIFISAFLLFQVQPLISRVILPWYGGTPAVWTTCMLFFQAMLLAGYCYAHLVQSMPARRQALVHGVLLAIGLLMCWVLPQLVHSDYWKPDAKAIMRPIPSILLLLTVNVGVPYLIASTTGPLLQAWFSRLYPNTSPYRLYALSNVGSLFALISYPAFFERYLPLWSQTALWSGLFVVFVVFCGYCAWKIYESSPPLDEKDMLDRLYEDQPGAPAATPKRIRVPGSTPSVGDHLLWILLAACGSTVFLATTNQMCEDIAVVPFLYILPLGLYLLSFILTFDSQHWYVRPGWGLLLILFAWGAVTIHDMGSNANIATQVVVYSLFVFTACMVCHGELSRLKPAPEYLTAFFLLISCGGMLGGLFVGVVAPNKFDGYWEFPIVLVAVFACFALAMIRSSENVSFLHWVGFGIVCVIGWGMCKDAYKFISKGDDDDAREYLFRGRNFFGSLEVYSTGKRKSGEEYTTLIHGRIEHGFQWKDPAKRRYHTTYYGDDSGIGLSINLHPRNEHPRGQERQLRIAMVGLGTGTTATYAGKGDYLRFYDINPMVVRIADQYFTHLKDAKEAGADVGVFLGDARIVMERQIDKAEKQNFDVIGLDAFSSDAIPAHLLTRECAEIYLKHMRDENEGILAIHVSNRYLILERICRALAREMKMIPIKIENNRDDTSGVYTSTWVVLSKNRKWLDKPEVREAMGMWLKSERALDKVWRDDYYNLFDVVDWSKSDEEVLEFKQDARKWFREKESNAEARARRMVGAREPSKWEKKLADEEFENALEDQKIAARRARQDRGDNDLDETQEDFKATRVQEARESEEEDRRKRADKRREEDEKRVKDRKAHHDALEQLVDAERKVEDAKARGGAAEEEEKDEPPAPRRE